jgi:hypothetical protein
VIAAACSGEQVTPQGRESSRLEQAIEKELGARVAVPVRAQCAWLPPSCRATLPDGTQLRLSLSARHGEVEWRLAGALVLADDVEVYLREALADLGAPQVARCGARIRAVDAGDRLECGLQNGGRAFVLVNGDGTTAVEIVLDPVAAAARGEVIRDAELVKTSKELEKTDTDDED